MRRDSLSLEERKEVFEIVVDVALQTYTRESFVMTRSARKEPVVHTGLRALSYARCGGSGSNSCTSEIIILSKCRAYARRAMNILEVAEACNAGVGRHVRGLCEDLRLMRLSSHL